MRQIKKELVSIIMPAYNSEKYIIDAINSVVNQTYTYWELIIIDDNSKDNTFELIRKNFLHESRIRVYKNKENSGVSASRNKGINLSNGEWIAFLDSDDIWKLEKIEKQMQLARKESANFIFTGAKYINEHGEYYEGVFEVPQLITYNRLKMHNVISCSSVLIKRCLLHTIRMENDDIHEDYAVWLRVLKSNNVAYGINEPLLIYRISKNSKSGNKFRTFKMTYGVYRFIGINPISSVFFMSSHVINSIKKYKKIKVN